MCETPDFLHLAATLRFRLVRAKEHWDGNTHLTLTDIITRFVEQQQVQRTKKTRQQRSAR